MKMLYGLNKMRIQTNIDSRPPNNRTMANHYDETNAVTSRYLIHDYLEVLAVFDISPDIDDYSSLLYVYLRFMSITSPDRRCTLPK